MAWWDIVSNFVNLGDTLMTPGRGLEGSHSRQFEIISKNKDEIILKSGRSPIQLTRDCFDVVEEFFKNNPVGTLRVASAHGPAYDRSADKLIREKTRIELARGNYVSSMLEKCGLVKYSMVGGKKVIGLS